MASPRRFPFDDEDRPSGSVRPLSQADLRAILAHLSDEPEELLAGTGADRPVVAVRVRASVGRPGGSAQATWRRMRASEWAAWTRTLPWRMAVILGIGAGGGFLGSLLATRLSLVVGGLAAMAAGLPDPGVVVLPVVAVHGAQVPWGKVVVEGVPVIAARRLPSMLRELPTVLGPERVAAVANQARIHFRAAA